MSGLLALIPARGGSKGLPGKNTRLLGGRPLIGWTIAAATASGVFSRVVVTTDSEDIAAVARECGAETPFLRPEALASDRAGSSAVVAHALDTCGFTGQFALLQPTSPFRNARHLREATAKFAATQPAAIVGATPAKPPAWTYRLAEGDIMMTLSKTTVGSRRQEFGALVQPNGSLYLMETAKFAASGTLLPSGTVGFLMDQVSSIDIDDLGDFRIAEAMLAGGLVDGQG